jgi:3-carboxy-cis,cis-muconate cycloisomerase
MTAEHGLLAPAWAGTEAAESVNDLALLRAMLDVEVALAEAQAELGVIPAAAAGAIRSAAASERFDYTALAEGVRQTANPVVGFVGQLTKMVESVDRDAAEYVHRGSTSQDILDTALMLLCRDVLRQIESDLHTSADLLVSLAERHRDTAMAARTLTQHAVPTTFGLKAVGWLSGITAALDRVRNTRRSLPVSMGGAAGTLAAYEQYAVLAGVGGTSPELPEAVARRLGLVAPTVPWHVVRIPMADIAAVLATTTGVLGKIAADVLVLSRTEIGELAEPAAPGRGASSAMPQKRNPVFATLIATAARQVPSLAQVLFQAMPAEDERPSGAWHAEWQALREALRSSEGAATNTAEMLAGLTVFPERMTANLSATGGAVVSERLNAALAGTVGKATAKQLLTTATASAERMGTSLAQTVADELAQTGHEWSVEQVAALLDPFGYPGIAAEITDQAITEYRKRAAAHG